MNVKNRTKNFMQSRNLILFSLLVTALLVDGNASASRKLNYVKMNSKHLGISTPELVITNMEKGTSLGAAVQIVKKQEKQNLILTAASIACDSSKDIQQKLLAFSKLVENPTIFFNKETSDSSTTHLVENLLIVLNSYKEELNQQIQNLVVEKKILESLKKEIEEAKSKSLEESIQKSTPLDEDEKFKELEKNIQELQNTIISLTGTIIESSNGTPVWISLSSSNFIHLNNLKTDVQVNDIEVRKTVNNLGIFYTTHIQNNISNLYANLVRPLAELDVNDLNSLDIAILGHANIQCGLSKLKLEKIQKQQIIHKFNVLYQEFKENYDFYTAEKVKTTLPGLREYSDVQNKYAELAHMVDENDYINFMEIFHTKKQTFVNDITKKIQPTKADLFYKLIDAVNLDYGNALFPIFLINFANEPSNKADKNYNQLPYVLIWQHTATSTEFNELMISNKRKYNKNTKKYFVCETGLESEYPFTLLKQNFPQETDKIGTLEKMFMMKYLNKKWTSLKRKFDVEFTQSIKNLDLKTQDIDAKPLLSETAKAQLESIFNNDSFLHEKIHVHLGALKIFEEHIKPALYAQHSQAWSMAGKEHLRENLKELYQIYTGLVKYGKDLYAKNPKIKEFHEQLN